MSIKALIENGFVSCESEKTSLNPTDFFFCSNYNFQEYK